MSVRRRWLAPRLTWLVGPTLGLYSQTPSWSAREESCSTLLGTEDGNSGAWAAGLSSTSELRIYIQISTDRSAVCTICVREPASLVGRVSMDSADVQTRLPVSRTPKLSEMIGKSNPDIPCSRGRPPLAIPLAVWTTRADGLRARYELGGARVE